jgi:hypothetical protein
LEAHDETVATERGDEPRNTGSDKSSSRERGEEGAKIVETTLENAVQELMIGSDTSEDDRSWFGRLGEAGDIRYPYAHTPFEQLARCDAKGKALIAVGRERQAEKGKGAWRVNGAACADELVVSWEEHAWQG